MVGLGDLLIPYIMTIQSIDLEIERLTKLRDSLEVKPTEGQRSLDEILEAVVGQYGVSAGLLKSENQTRHVSDARKAFAFIAGQCFFYSQRRIAYQISQSDSSISISTKKAGDLYSYDPKFRSMVDAIKKALGL